MNAATSLNAAGLSGRRQLIGTAMVVVSTVSIGVVPTFGKFAYEGGSTPLTVITLRSAVMVLLVLAGLIALGRSLAIPRRALAISLGMGPIYALMSYGLLGAVQYMPVSLAVLIYFLHPLMVGLVAPMMGHDRLGRLRLGALTAALAGLALTLGPTSDGLDPWGMALALMAAVTCTIMIIGNTAAMREADSVLVTFYMALSTTVVLAAACVVAWDVSLPVTTMGWGGLTGVAVAYTLGMLTFFGAIPLIGAMRATMISNLEPLLGILFAIVVLGETVSLLQGAGIALVLGSIVVFEMKPPSA